MRALAIAIMFSVAQISVAGQQKPLPKNAKYTFAAFVLLVSEFYVVHHTWPTSEKQLRACTADLTRQFPSDAQQIIPVVWSRMTHVEFTPRGKDVLLTTRFKQDGRDYSYAAILHPGASAEHIGRKMTIQ